MILNIGFKTAKWRRMHDVWWNTIPVCYVAIKKWRGTVEPRFNEVAGDRPNSFVKSRSNSFSSALHLLLRSPTQRKNCSIKRKKNSTVEPLFNKNLNVTNGFFVPVIIVKYMKKNLDIANPRFNERIWPVSSDFVKSNFHCTSPFPWKFWKQWSISGYFTKSPILTQWHTIWYRRQQN